MTTLQSFINEGKNWCNLIAEKVEPSLLENWREQLRTLEQLEDQHQQLQLSQELYRSWSKWYDASYDNVRQGVAIGQHKLPALTYPYNALEPYIDEATMRLHHDIHHQSYVDGLNQAEKELARARKTNDFTLIKHWERELAFHGAGHYLHSIFWKIMCPTGGGQPTGDIEREIKRSFGSFSAFKQQFSKAAEKVEGSGWAILVWSRQAQRLEILQAEKHQNLSQWDVIPLLVLDVWEHAYYLKYQSKGKSILKIGGMSFVGMK